MNKIYLLDTNAISQYASRRHPRLSALVDRHLDSVIISAVVLAEMEYGWRKAGDTHRVLAQKNFVRRFVPLAFDAGCAVAYGFIKHYLLHGLPNSNSIGERDMLIAAQAYMLNAVLITNNTSEFSRVPGLEVEDWQIAARS